MCLFVQVTACFTHVQHLSRGTDKSATTACSFAQSDQSSLSAWIAFPAKRRCPQRAHPAKTRQMRRLKWIFANAQADHSVHYVLESWRKYHTKLSRATHWYALTKALTQPKLQFSKPFIIFLFNLRHRQTNPELGNLLSIPCSMPAARLKHLSSKSYQKQNRFSTPLFSGNCLLAKRVWESAGKRIKYTDP